jgi:hypothetical protein
MSPELSGGGKVGIIWKGVDGALYEFSEHPHASDWEEVGGVFIFAARLDDGNWNPLYIASSECLSRRIPNDEKWPWAVHLGANGVLACAVADGIKRVKLVAEMIARLKPPLNDYPQEQVRAATPLRCVQGRRA